MDPLLMITDADASQGDHDALQAALEVLRERTDVEVTKTSNPGELDGVLHRAGSRRLVVAGGDGSLHAVVAALHRRHELDHRTLGLLPLGTGNDFARNVGLPLDMEAAAGVILDGTPCPMDLVVDELGQVAVNNVHLGASGLAGRRDAGWKARLQTYGVGRPLDPLVRAVRPPSIRVRVEADGEIIADMDRPVRTVEVGNGASLDGDTEIVPSADPSDGRVDVLISFATGPLARVGQAAGLLRGSRPGRDDAVRHRASQVSVTGEDFWLSSDGGAGRPERRRTWHVEPAAYSLLV